MKKLTIGILAHVDSGKTTLSEALLYLSGAIKRLGRVDHRDAFLDTFALERERGITIFSKQALLRLPGAEFTLLDTPGHADFSAEMERTLQVLDCAILVVSGTDGVQAHTETLWRLLRRYEIPTFLFVNKMDLAGAERSRVLDELQNRLDENILDFSPEEAAERPEALALCGETLMEELLGTGAISDASIAEAVARREVYPCWFGSALHLEGVEEFLRGLGTFAKEPERPAAFGAKVYKVARDSQGVRLTCLKVTGGALRVKTLLRGRTETGEDWAEKADQLRLYSGAKFQPVEEAPAGTVCAVTGLTHTRPGMGLGAEPDSPLPALEPVMVYELRLPKDADPYAAYLRLRELEEEDPQLHLVWEGQTRKIHVQLMGQIQLEILRTLIRERFGLAVTFGEGSIVYKETIAAPVIGMGHFEPLRHYAEVHLLLEPGERGSGLVFDTVCSPDTLDTNWQRLILTHLAEREHPGVLTGSPITDMKLTLLTGRAHTKHTEGGDFRQATYRAVRQGLMQAETILLEPWYALRLEVPGENLGRAMADIQRMEGEFDPPELTGGTAVLTGAVPVSELGDYPAEVAAYTRGRGRLVCSAAGYRPCHNQAEVVAARGYDPERDTENPADSVFCSHGAGTIIKWNEVRERMHLDSSGFLPADDAPEDHAPVTVHRGGAAPAATDAELQKIFEKTYGAIRRSDPHPMGGRSRTTLEHYPQSRVNFLKKLEPAEEFLLVDGYNIIFAWDDLKELARTDLDAAREALVNILCSYQGYRGCGLILVFDAYKVKNNPGSVEKRGGIYVVYTRQAETADMYIEKVTYEIGRKYRVRVATSDGMEQLIILGHGAVRISARLFRQEVEEAEGAISALLEGQHRG